MNNLSKMSLDELYDARDAIYERCSSWKNSKDGSYGMALHSAGLDKVDAEIEVREAEEM